MATKEAFTRWWILAIYSYVSGLQSLLWMTWSSVPTQSKEYLNVGDSTLDLWLNLGPIAYCVSVFLAAWVLLARPDGIRISVLLGSGLCFLASLIRSIPAVVSSDLRTSGRAIAAVHIGQALNAAVAPLVVASPSYLSLIWFPEDRRNVATAIGNVANAVGRGVGFFLGPAIVSTSGDLPMLLLVEIGLAALPFFCSLMYYPAMPSEPPSAAAAEEIAKLAAMKQRAKLAGGGPEDKEGLLLEHELEEGEAVQSGGQGTFIASLTSAIGDFKACLRSPGLVLLTISGGLQMAVYGAWSGTLPSVLSPRFSDGQAGAMGSLNTFIGCVGGLAVGMLTDHPRLRKSLKSAVIVLCVSSAVIFGVLAMALGPAAISSVQDNLSFGALLALCAFAGLLRGGADPLFFELSAELVHPTPAGTAGKKEGVPRHACMSSSYSRRPLLWLKTKYCTQLDLTHSSHFSSCPPTHTSLSFPAGGVLTFIYHIILVGCLSVPPAAMNWSMLAMALALLLAAGLLLPVKVAYVRR